MKKYIIFLFSAIALTITSCTNSDEIEINMYHDVILNVNTVNTYEKWSRNDYEHFLGNNKSSSVGVISYIYNKEGKLCRKLTNYVKTFNTVTQKVEHLEEGEYTIVSIETIVNDEDGFQSSMWDIINEESLNTLMICPKENRIVSYWYEAFGVDYKTINIGYESNVINIEPKVVGCLINIAYENIADASYNYFSFSSQNNASGYFLDPNRNNSNKYYYDPYQESNVWSSLGYFYSKDGVLVDSDETTIYTFQTGNRPYLFGASKNMWVNGNLNFDDDITGTFNFEDGEMYIAYAYYKGEPTDFECYLDRSENFQSWYEKLDKTMNPIFAEPCTTWGSTVSYVKSFMKDYTLSDDISYGQNGFYWIGYWGRYRENYIEYDFKTETSGLSQVFITVLEENATENAIISMLNNSSYEYDKYYEEEGYHLYSDNKTYVAVFPNLESEDGIRYSIIQYIDRSIVDAENQSPMYVKSAFKSINNRKNISFKEHNKLTK